MAKGGNNNNGKGNKRNNGARRSRRPGGNLARTATRNVNVATWPSMQEIQRRIQNAINNSQNEMMQYNSLYGGSADVLSKMSDDLGPMVDATKQQFMGDSQQFADMLVGAGIPASEVSAAGSLYGVTGQNALSNFANAGLRYGGYNQSAQRENQLSKRYSILNASGTLQDTLDALYQERQGIQDQKTSMIQQELQRLREERRQKQADEAYNRMIEALMTQALGTDNGTNINIDTSSDTVIPADERNNRSNPRVAGHPGDPYTGPGSDRTGTRGSRYQSNGTTNPNWALKAAGFNAIDPSSPNPLAGVPSWLVDYWVLIANGKYAQAQALRGRLNPKQQYIVANTHPPAGLNLEEQQGSGWDWLEDLKQWMPGPSSYWW